MNFKSEMLLYTNNLYGLYNNNEVRLTLVNIDLFLLFRLISRYVLSLALNSFGIYYDLDTNVFLFVGRLGGYKIVATLSLAAVLT